MHYNFHTSIILGPLHCEVKPNCEKSQNKQDGMELAIAKVSVESPKSITSHVLPVERSHSDELTYKLLAFKDFDMNLRDFDLELKNFKVKMRRMEFERRERELEIRRILEGFRNCYTRRNKNRIHM